MDNGLYDGVSHGLYSGLQIGLDNGLVEGLYRDALLTAVDVDAAKFIELAQLTDPRHIVAVNNLALSLKKYGLWYKMFAIYPMIGGTEQAHKFNLKNPADTNAAFRIVFNGVWTHSSTGAKPDGGAGTFGNTNLNGVTAITLTNGGSLSYYSRTQNIGANGEIGINIAGGYFELFISFSNTFLADTFDATVGAGRISIANTNTKGFYAMSRVNANDFRAYKNGLQFGATAINTPSGSAAGNNPMWIGGIQGLYHSAKECAFAHIGSAMTAQDMYMLNKLVQECQIYLGREIA